MKRPLAYITAAWCGDDDDNMERAARYCRIVYEAGFSPVCPALYLPLFLNDAVPEEHKNGIDMARDLLRRSRVLVVCGHSITEAMKNDIAVAQRLAPKSGAAKQHASHRCRSEGPGPPLTRRAQRTAALGDTLSQGAPGKGGI